MLSCSPYMRLLIPKRAIIRIREHFRHHGSSSTIEADELNKFRRVGR